MAAAVTEIPVVDFNAMSLEKKDPLKENGQAVKIVAEQVYQAFSTTGFVYLKNHGIPQQTKKWSLRRGGRTLKSDCHILLKLQEKEINQFLKEEQIMVDLVFETYDQFFNLSPEVKTKYAKKVITSPNGWDAVERERTNPDRPADLKESFDIECLDESFMWPNAELPNFCSTLVSFYKTVTDLALRILTVMAVGLELEPDAFTRAFNKMGTSEGGAQLRYNFYPKIEDPSHVKVGQIRCGEHTDYGAISVLFQDDIGGLEVKNVNGQFVSAPPIKGTVLVNIADLMQRWTADKLKSSVHRVLIPESELHYKLPRRSLVLFTDPDHEEIIECVDGSNKYPPITSGEWKKKRLLETYTY